MATKVPESESCVDRAKRIADVQFDSESVNALTRTSDGSTKAPSELPTVQVPPIIFELDEVEIALAVNCNTSQSEAKTRNIKCAPAGCTMPVQPAAAPPTNLIGMRCLLPDTCRCGTAEVVLTQAVPPHDNGMRCSACNKHRGWVPREVIHSLRQTIKKFGRIEEPIRIRRTEPALRDLRAKVFAAIHRASDAQSARNSMKQFAQDIAALDGAARQSLLDGIERAIANKGKPR
jgi:hypothetical protein